MATTSTSRPTISASRDGSIELIIGPMFSGKSTELVRRVRRHKAAGRLCLLVNSRRDNRYSEGQAVVTHDKTELTATSIDCLAEVQNAAWQYSVIAVDEGQFMPDLVEFAELWANEGKTVIIAALDATFQRLPFKQVVELIPRAEEVSKLKAICHNCRKEAAFTKRIAPETDVTLVGGADKYVAACRNCHSNTSTSSIATPSRPTNAENKAPNRQTGARKSSRLSSSSSGTAQAASSSRKESMNRRESFSRRDSLEALSQPCNTSETYREHRRRSLQAVTIR
ncbi:hypothetical protein WJX72_001854 [[Myrmecia] bisecta]|uniref:Thymidine kinase n=1 Tax=[Myrmecia] bisecta TaxID=41462 RepID=A0AAW1P5U6_9CHLO